MVPVLSRQSTSTLASSSTVASSFARAFLRASARIPAMNAMLVNSTSPSGTIATAAPTVPRRASCQRSSSARSRQRSSSDTGGMIHVSQRRTRSTPERSSELTRRNTLAWSAS